MKPSSVPTWLSEEKERQQNSGHEGIDSSTNNGNNTDGEAEVKSTSKYCYCIGNQDPVLCWFCIYHFVCGCLGIISSFANICFIINSHKQKILDARSFWLHLYAAICSISIVFIELDWRIVVDGCAIFDRWIIRGFYYFFIGILTSTQIMSLSSFINFNDIMGICLMVMGICYTLMGVFCVKGFYLSRSAQMKRQNVIDTRDPASGHLLGDDGIIVYESV